MRRFVRPEIAAVGGRVNALNANENWLTRMQAIKYYFGYEYMKNLERAFNQVMCLSGCLTAYRRHVLMELEPILESLGFQSCSPWFQATHDRPPHRRGTARPAPGRSRPRETPVRPRSARAARTQQ